MPGVAAGKGADVGTIWLSGTEQPTPTQVADRMKGRTFANFDAYRMAYWKAVSSVPELLSQFDSLNQTLISKGLSPLAPKDQHRGKVGTYQLHHVESIAKGGAVYDADNIVVVSPL